MRKVVDGGKNKNTSLAAPGALANRLQRRTARKANEANLEFPNLKTEITSLTFCLPYPFGGRQTSLRPPKSKIQDHFSLVLWVLWSTFAK